jgi:hypothetical protein
MEDALQRDLAQAGRSEPVARIACTADPLLHIIRELRNLEIHLHSSSLTAHEITVFWRDRTNPDREHALTDDAWCIDDLTPQRFSLSRNARHYTQANMQRLVKWFNAAQQEWGVAELVRLAILRYRRLIIDRYQLAPPSGTSSHLELGR